MDWTRSKFKFPVATSRSREERIILYYRGIYMANNEFNRVLGTIVIPYLKLGIILNFVSAVFACARLFDSMDLISLAFVSVLSVTSMALLVPISIVMSKLYDLSLNFSRNMFSETLQITEKKNRRIPVASLKSCPLIRCKVGNWHYMEEKANS